MARESFSDKLKNASGLRNITFTIPHPFLPPRLRKKAANRNLLICVDVNMWISAHWEGARREEIQVWSPAEAKKIMTEVNRRAAEYAQDSSEFLEFLSTCDDAHEWELGPDYRVLDPRPDEVEEEVQVDG